MIGGGPAGLKFAETAAELGHEVTLWERACALGGQVRRATRLPDYASWGNLIQDLSFALRRVGVTIALETEATVDKVRAFGAEEVILATGARWTTDGFSTFRTDRDAIPQGAGAHVLDPVSALDHRSSAASACSSSTTTATTSRWAWRGCWPRKGAK